MLILALLSVCLRNSQIRREGKGGDGKGREGRGGGGERGEGGREGQGRVEQGSGGKISAGSVPPGVVDEIPPGGTPTSGHLAGREAGCRPRPVRSDASRSAPSTKKTKASREYRTSKNAKLDVADFLDDGGRGNFRALGDGFWFLSSFSLPTPHRLLLPFRCHGVRGRSGRESE